MIIRRYKGFVKLFLFAVLVVLEFIFGYGFWLEHWSRFVISTVLIIITTAIFYPAQWNKYLGICLSLRWFGLLILGSVLVGILVHMVVYVILPPDMNMVLAYPLGYVFTFFQSCSEELVFRGLFISLLLSIVRSQSKFKSKLYKLGVILVPAVVFSVLHYYAYQYLFLDRGMLEFTALVTLVLFSASLNLIMVYSGNLLLPIIFHFGWNSTRFASLIVFKGSPVPEYIRFNLMEGSYIVLGLSFVMFVSSYLYFLKPSRRYTEVII